MAEQNQIWTIGRILKWTEQYFGQKGIESPRLDAEVLLSHVLGKQRIYLYVHFDEPLQAEELALYRAMIRQRVEHMPVAYILGEAADNYALFLDNQYKQYWNFEAKPWIVMM